MTALAVRERFPDLPRGERIFFKGLVAASRPVEDLTLSEWADRHRIVSSESGSPWPGAFRTDRVPYLREPQDCLHPDHPARRVTARWAAQLGKSTAIENWFGYIVDQAPGSMMIVLPTLDEATKFNRVKLQPTIDATPRIRHKVVPVNSRDEQASTTAFKRFAGGFAQVVNAGSSKGLQMVSIKYLAMDEVTGYPRDVDGRGSPRDQARARQKMYGDFAKEWQGSTPGLAGECAITADFDGGDRRHYYVPCPHCDAYQPLIWDQMRGPDEEKGLPVHMRCIACDGVIRDGHKPEMLRRGVWIPTRVPGGADPVPQTIAPDELERWQCEPCEGRCNNWQPSYHLWAAYAPRERWADLWDRWQQAQDDITKLRTFCQQDLAEPYDPGGVAMDAESIVDAARAHPYPARQLPPGAGILVSAADVQGYGIKWAVYAIGPRDQTWLVDREVFEGSPDQSDEPWLKLADALERKYPTAGGGEHGIDLSGVDSGFMTDRVYRFCAARPNCYALDGRPGSGLPALGTPSKRDIRARPNGPLVRKKAQLYPVGAYDLKTKLMAALANQVEGPGADGAFPRNTLHLTPELCDQEFAEELTAERLVDPDEEAQTATGKRGKRLIKANAGRQWKKIVGRKNDWLDVTVYAFALAWQLVSRRKLNAERWADLLVRVHGVPDKERDLFSIDADDGPFAPSTAQPNKDSDSASRREKWRRR